MTKNATGDLNFAILAHGTEEVEKNANSFVGFACVIDGRAVAAHDLLFDVCATVTEVSSSSSSPTNSEAKWRLEPPVID